MSHLLIEYPSVGATYSRNEYGVYEYGTYPRSSVLAGRTRRVWLDAYPTLAAAKAAYPEAKVAAGTAFVEDSLLDLPDSRGRRYERDDW